MFRRAWHWRILRLILEGQFRVIWPLAARLPPSWGRRLARALGRLCARLDLDWRSAALREQYVAARTRQAFATMFPDCDPAQLDELVKQRFQYAALEELEGHWLALGRVDRFRCTFEGLSAVREAMSHGRGIVLLTMHFDAVLMGVAQLGRAGLRLNLMTSNVVEDARVPQAVRRYFAAKYAGIAAQLRGGQALHVESHLKSFYRALAAGEGVAILGGDAPAGRMDVALPVDFFGGRRAFAPGAFRLAEKMRAPMAAFVCLRVADDAYHLVFSPVYWPTAAGHGSHASAMLGFLEAQLKHYPERWWAADQLPNFLCLDAPNAPSRP